MVETTTDPRPASPLVGGGPLDLVVGRPGLVRATTGRPDAGSTPETQ
jgi:hypothetical protein